MVSLCVHVRFLEILSCTFAEVDIVNATLILDHSDTEKVYH